MADVIDGGRNMWSRNRSLPYGHKFNSSPRIGDVHARMRIHAGYSFHFKGKSPRPG